MKVIIAGSRKSYPIVEVFEDALLEIEHLTSDTVHEVVSGGAPGVDRLGEIFARSKGLRLTVIPADWNKFGKSAGAIRNQQMADYADALILLWDGVSRGSKNMLETMQRQRKPCVVKKV